MRWLILSATSMVLSAACATAPQAAVESRTLAFACNDIIVVGRVENDTYQSVENENGLFGRGWISANVRVRDLMRGTGIPSVLPVKYLAHTQMREDRDFMLVLNQTSSGYEIKSGQLMSLRPLLASRCE